MRAQQNATVSVPVLVRVVETVTVLYGLPPTSSVMRLLGPSNVVCARPASGATSSEYQFPCVFWKPHAQYPLPLT